MPLLMAVTIIVIAGFQVYWLTKTYEREERNLDRNSNMLFGETVFGLQTAKLKLDKITVDSNENRKITIQRELGKDTHVRVFPKDKMARLVDVIMKKTSDSSRRKIFFRSVNDGDSNGVFNQAMSSRQKRILEFISDIDSLQDSIRVKEIETVYSKKLADQKMEIPFTISRVETRDTGKRIPNEITLGFAHPITYRLALGNTFPHLIKRIMPAILFSVFLVGFTILSFTLLYRNLLRQRKLGEIKNEFISNITHELKTPIATVSVAIEALRSFGASINPQKTAEYLDISANELQRLSLLVDKVLKLSMFEKKQIELRYEALDLRQLADEVIASMRLQFEKRKAIVNITSDNDTSLQGDRLHLVSVLFNLLDNALKYTEGNPQIDISIIKNDNDHLQLIVGDNGIGIPTEYQHRIFEKFFRVPHGNLHNAKGYGLGLSYVAHVVEQHKGTIKVESNGDNGSRFTIILPKTPA